MAVHAQRPFTGSGSRSAHALTVLVHCGEHLESLTKNRTGNGVYVSLGLTQETTSASTKEVDETELYDRRNSPFATSCVVDSTEFLVWNELMVLSLPVDWRRQPDAASWTLNVDVVWRDSRQHEDLLLASIRLPLLQVLSEQSPKHVACDIEQSGDCGAPCRPRIYLSITETADMEAAEEVVEIIIQDSVGRSFSNRSCSVVLSPHNQIERVSWRDLFQVLGSRAISGDVSDPKSTSVWISPRSKPKEVTRDEFKREWHFPMVLYRNAAGALGSLESYNIVHAFLYTGYDSAFVASTKLDLSIVPKTGEAVDVVSGLDSLDDTLNLDTRLRATVRRWDASTWMAFNATRPRRRIVASNRKVYRRRELQELEWTGAICRGLKRYPLSSICDDVGISALLFRYLTVSHDSSSPHVGYATSSASETGTGRQQNEHIRLLQQELMAKQETIHKLQQEVEARDSALQSCAVNLITARTEIKARDELIAQLKQQLAVFVEREAAQARKLTADLDVTGIRMDSEAGRRLSLLITKYKELEKNHVAAQRELDDTRRSITTLDSLQAKYTELQRAHLVQAGLVQKLQQDKIQFSNLQKTIRLQEKVIRKMENAVAAHKSDDARCVANDQRVGGSSAVTDISSGDLQSAPSAVRLRILEQQLQTNSKAAAVEIAQLKMRIMELETQISETNRRGINRHESSVVENDKLAF